MLPKMDLPYVIVVTSYSGAGPYEVENLVTRNIESAVSTIAGVKNVYSTSSEGSSIVQMEFNEGVDLDFATIDIREKVDLIKRILPDGIGTPMIIKMDPSMMPVAVVAISDSARNKYELNDHVENTIQSRLERIVGVASISLSGTNTQE
jgi:HAE1 family hydrophobic/amphiphilic exporter-1